MIVTQSMAYDSPLKKTCLHLMFGIHEEGNDISNFILSILPKILDGYIEDAQPLGEEFLSAF